MFTKRIVFLTASLLAMTGTAHAQNAPGNSVQDRFRQQQERLSPSQVVKDALLTGRDDLLLLRPTRHLSLSGGYTRFGTNNAALSPDDVVDDHYGVANLQLQWDTTIAERVQLFANVGVVSTRYDNSSALDYSAVSTTVGAAGRLAGFDMSVVYAPSFVFRGEFGPRQLRQARLAGNISKTWTIKGFAIQPEINAQRTWANPSDYNNRSVGARLTLSKVIGKTRPVQLFATTGYERRSYDDYFSGLVGVQRRDKVTDTTIGVQWPVTPLMTLSGQFSRERNVSTSDVNGYKADSGQIGVSLRARF